MDINAGQLIFAGAFLLLGIFMGAMITYAKFVLYRKKAQETEEEKKKHELYAQEMKDLFLQTADALASAIDAKDKYTSGHSRRVAEYSRRIAELSGYSETECESIYYAGLLHDVGKIGIPDEIIMKNGKLTEDEYNSIKQHPVFGTTILDKVSKLPYLSVGANFHHERYDGKGYPLGLKGVDIPEMARIIAVADAYDAMTSCRSYRSPMAQQKVREELVKGLGTQFDPEFGHCMLHILDMDVEYKLKDEQQTFKEFLTDYTFEGDKESFTNGVAFSEKLTRISFNYEAKGEEESFVPSMVVFDSLDSIVYTDEYLRDKMDSTDFFGISFDGTVKKGYIRDFHIREEDRQASRVSAESDAVVEIVRQKDHLLIRLILADVIREYTIAMWDRSQFAFVAFTGTWCSIHNFRIEKEEQEAEEGYIERIADEISYIKDKPEGDLENLEIAGWREKNSKGVEIIDNMTLTFHSMSLPAARRMWHCPYISVFVSEDGTINGEGYQELSLIRLDGERWEDCDLATNKFNVVKDESFVSWEDWKKANREGVDCRASFDINEERVIVMAEDYGVKVESIITFTKPVDKVYFALSGDQVALTDIRIR